MTATYRDETTTGAKAQKGETMKAGNRVQTPEGPGIITEIDASKYNCTWVWVMLDSEDYSKPRMYQASRIKPLTDDPDTPHDWDEFAAAVVMVAEAPASYQAKTTTTTTTQPQAEQLALYARARQPYAGLEIRAQLAQVREATSTKASTPGDIVALCEDLRQLAQEAFNVITVDAKNKVIARHLVSLGILDATLVHPREVFRPAILDGAAAIICVHNHPSGDPSPSAEDLKITRQLVEAGKVLDVKLLDHVIIGRPGPASAEGYLSLRESGLCQF